MHSNTRPSGIKHARISAKTDTQTRSATFTTASPPINCIICYVNVRVPPYTPTITSEYIPYLKKFSPKNTRTGNPLPPTPAPVTRSPPPLPEPLSENGPFEGGTWLSHAQTHATRFFPFFLVSRAIVSPHFREVRLSDTGKHRIFQNVFSSLLFFFSLYFSKFSGA